MPIDTERLHTARVERVIAAPPRTVWQCWTDPLLFKQWFCPKPWQVTKADFNVQVGGRMDITMEGPDGECQVHRAVWLEICPLRKLVFTDSFTEGFNPAEEPFMTGFVELSETSEGQTEMIWGASHKSEDDLQTHLNMGFEQGWGTAVDQLNELATKQADTTERDESLRRLLDEVPKVRTCLWFEEAGEKAVKFYVSLLEDSYIEDITRHIDSSEALTIDFTLHGSPYMVVIGGPHYKLSPAVSISVITEDQAETDRLWSELLSNGGTESQCGWLTDRFGLSWQIVPQPLIDYLGSSDSSLVKRVMKEMYQMKKIEISRLDAAAKG